VVERSERSNESESGKTGEAALIKRQKTEKKDELKAVNEQAKVDELEKEKAAAAKA